MRSLHNRLRLMGHTNIGGDKMKHIESILLAWQKITQLLERVLIDNISATVPWLAPIVPAWMAYRNMTTHLEFPWWVALLCAIAVEFLGLSAVSTAVKFWRFNDEKRKIDKNAPVLLAAMAGLFYVVVILIVNAVLDLNQSIEIKVLAKALLSLLAADAAVIIVLRSQHQNKLADIDNEKKARKEKSHESHEVPVEVPHILIDTFESYMELNGTRNGNGPVKPVELIETYGVPKSTAYRWYREYVEQTI